MSLPKPSGAVVKLTEKVYAKVKDHPKVRLLEARYWTIYIQDIAICDVLLEMETSWEVCLFRFTFVNPVIN